MFLFANMICLDMLSEEQSFFILRSQATWICNTSFVVFFDLPLQI